MGGISALAPLLAIACSDRITVGGDRNPSRRRQASHRPPELLRAAPYVTAVVYRAGGRVRVEHDQDEQVQVLHLLAHVPLGGVQPGLQGCQRVLPLHRRAPGEETEEPTARSVSRNLIGRIGPRRRRASV